MSSIQKKGYFKQHEHSAFSRINKVSQDTKCIQTGKKDNSKNKQSTVVFPDITKKSDITRKQAFSYIKKLFHPCCD